MAKNRESKQPASADAAPQQVRISGDSTFLVNAKDAAIIISFLVYVGVTIAGYAYATGKLDAVEADNKEMLGKMTEIQQEISVNNEIVKRLEVRMEKIYDRLIEGRVDLKVENK